MTVEVALARARVGLFHCVAVALSRRLSFLRLDSVFPFLILSFVKKRGLPLSLFVFFLSQFFLSDFVVSIIPIKTHYDVLTTLSKYPYPFFRTLL